MRTKNLFIAAILVVLIFAFKRQQKILVTADQIFINGRILTMDSTNSIVQAIAVKDGKIVAVGNTEEIKKYKGDQTIANDLKGKTMVPGLIDGHSHFMSLGRASAVNVSPPPVGEVHNMAELVAAIQQFKKEKNVKDGEWISAYGYDQDQLAEKRHPEKEDMDLAFPNNPIVISHVSGHMSVANSLALKLSGIDSNTPDPEGGIIVRKKGSKEPTGLLQERAARLLKRTDSKRPTIEEQLALLKDQEKYYASFGITTAQDGSTAYESLKLLKEAAKRDELFIDIESLAAYAIVDTLLKNPAEYAFGTLDHHLKIAGFKLVADGSPQGKTAFFSKPYLTDVPGCTHDDCTGIPTVTQQQFDEAITKGYKNNIQTFVHCNGDATIDMYIHSVEKADKDLNTTSTSRRSVIIHSQFVRNDQLDKYKELGMVPALFTNHAFFWGDVHLRNLGKERGEFLSPTKTAIKKKIIFTNHTDFGVTPLNQMFLLWTSVARESRTGQVIGANERLTPMEGLRAITINGAYQYFEEKIKGSLEKGKLADLVILSADPTTIDPSKIKDIIVLETIKEGKSIYKKKDEITGMLKTPST